MKRHYLFFIVAALFISVQTPAQGSLITYDDKAAFLTQTGAVSATGPLPELGRIPGGSAGTQTVGSVTFSIALPSSEFFIGTPSPGDWTSLNPGADIAISGPENLNLNMATPVHSLGFDFVEPSNVVDFIDSTFEVTLKNAGTSIGSFTFNAPNDVLAFVGVSSSSLFDRVEIREIIGGDENEYFGQVYTADGAIPNPEPATFLLLGSGMAGLAVWQRKSLMRQAQR